ncbi:hypothetical protein D3C85_1906260 [compost metagenome]
MIEFPLTLPLNIIAAGLPETLDGTKEREPVATLYFTSDTWVIDVKLLDARK